MMIRTSLCMLLLIAPPLVATGTLCADEGESFEQAAEKLQAATFTVRVSKTDKKSPEVTVFTGVSIGSGIVVTPLFTPDETRIRITMPGGVQAEARPRVLDEYSGLALLQIENHDAPRLTLAKEAPKVGGWVLSGAAWGVEKAVVSLGIVSGVDRTLSGANYPPLLQCDLRTATTSSGAAVVNNRGELLGVVVAAESEEGGRGWTYAVPVKHVERLLRTLAEKKGAAAAKDGVVVLKPRRPVVGMVLGPAGERDVVVKQVREDGPAEKAGIREGEEILAADGIVIRSVYQAVRPLLYKQPGDLMSFLVRDQQGEVRSVEVVLSGGVLLPSAPSVKVANLIEPKVIVSGPAAAEVVRHGGQHLAEVAAGDPDLISDDDGAAKYETLESLQQKIRLQEKALDRYRSAIAAQQTQLGRALQDRLETQKEILELKAQIEQLRRQLEPTGASAPRP